MSVEFEELGKIRENPTEEAASKLYFLCVPCICTYMWEVYKMFHTNSS